MSVDISVILTEQQAQRVYAVLVAYQQAELHARLTLDVVTAGHVPDGAHFVSINPQTGVLVMRAPSGGSDADPTT